MKKAPAALAEAFEDQTRLSGYVVDEPVRARMRPIKRVLM